MFDIKRKYIIIVMSFLLVVVSGCNKISKPQYIDLKEQLISQLDFEADDYLKTIKKEKEKSIVLDSLICGSFSTEDDKQILAVYKVLNTPHAAGLERTIVAIYDADTFEFICQKSFGADNVDINVYKDINNRKFILYLGKVTYQGYTTYTLNLFKIEEGEWIDHDSFSDESSENYAFAISGDLIHVMELSYSDYIPVYENKYTLIWDEISAKFIKSEG